MQKNQLLQNQLVTEIAPISAPISGVILPLRATQKDRSFAYGVIRGSLGAAIKLNRDIIKKPVDISKP